MAILNRMGHEREAYVSAIQEMLDFIVTRRALFDTFEVTNDKPQLVALMARRSELDIIEGELMRLKRP
jgi:hypothetical protein